MFHHFSAPVKQELFCIIKLIILLLIFVNNLNLFTLFEKLLNQKNVLYNLYIKI
jgi:hypothetical protein